jgi:hypothetical protein
MAVLGPKRGERRYVSNFSKSSSITSALRRRSLKKASVVASGMLFITPIPTNSSKLAPVIHLEFKLFIAEVEKLLENEHLEKDQRINQFASCVALPLVGVALVKQRAD